MIYIFSSLTVFFLTVNFIPLIFLQVCPSLFSHQIIVPHRTPLPSTTPTTTDRSSLDRDSSRTTWDSAVTDWCETCRTNLARSLARQKPFLLHLTPPLVQPSPPPMDQNKPSVHTPCLMKASLVFLR